MTSPTLSQSNKASAEPSSRRELISSNSRYSLFAIRSRKGFTLIEILIVTAIFTVLAGLGLFMAFNTYSNTSLRSERDTVVSLLEQARGQAMSNINQSTHGFCFVKPYYIVFEGNNCATAATSTKKELTPAGAILASSTLPATGIVFTQLSGTTTWMGTTTLTQGDKSTEIYINSEGMVRW